ncbi:MAG: acyl-CoA thioesterase [Desulfobacteraceae bacterium 4572_35.1]|nr:MAG: acyl-CoA thioesterase [Desulfobacteraceae bacterium 4572_35.1]
MDQDDKLGPHQVIMNEWLECAPFEQLLGIKLISAENGNSVMTLPFLAQFANGGNLLHGGALVTLADTAAVMAIKSLLEPGSHFGTIHMDVDFIRPVIQGLITASCSAKQIEERLWDAFVVLRNDNGLDVMQMQAKFKVSRRSLQD